MRVKLTFRKTEGLNEDIDWFIELPSAPTIGQQLELEEFVMHQGQSLSDYEKEYLASDLLTVKYAIWCCDEHGPYIDIDFSWDLEDNR